MRKLGPAIGLVLAAALTVAHAARPPFASQHPDATPFVAAWQQAASAAPLNPRRDSISGLAVPHHLPAAGLIALGFRTAAASGARPTRVIIIAPDHHKRAGRPFATSLRAHDTPVGRVAADRAFVGRLLRSALVEDSDLIGHEHGIGVVLPFVRLAYPGVPVVPIAVSATSRRRHWNALVALLLRQADANTLVVQSTDFSHYLSLADAVRHDQQTLDRLATGDPDALAALHQPRHVDSTGAQYVQALWQRQRHGATPVVLANWNSADRGVTDDRSTTSYMLHVYGRAMGSRVVLPPPDPAAASRTLCIAGDAHFGRHVARALAVPAVRARVFAAWRERLGGCPLVLNLEGVLADAPLDDRPLVRGIPRLAMPADDTLRALSELGVVAVAVANNHALDFGAERYAAMVRRLAAAGFVVLEHGQARDVNGFEIVALRDVDNAPRDGVALVSDADVAAVAAAAATNPRTIAFLHWGAEFVPEPGARERDLATRLATAGARWVVGAHPHVAAPRLEMVADGRTLLAYSLGNFAFDQPAPPASGAVLQITCFAQGSCATRRVPLPGLDELGAAPRR